MLPLWILRLGWLGLPFVAGPSLADALHGASGPVRGLASAGLWAGWAIGLVALLVPRTIGLTALRVVAAALVAAVGAAALGGHVSPAGLALSSALLGVAVTAEVGEVFVQGSAYGSERRFPLRAPGPVLLALAPLGWALLVAGIATGPLLLAAEQWVSGVVGVLVGGPLAVAAARALHSLARRWVVFVPAGLVLHDRYTLDDPVLFPRGVISGLGPAEAATDALDLTAAAPGLALELQLRESVPMVQAPAGWRRRTPGETGRVSQLIFTPSRPGRVLAEARARKLPVR